MNNLFDPLLSSYPIFQTIIKTSGTSGYLYLLRNSQYPNHIKIGLTRDLSKRLDTYNCTLPFPSARYTYISKPFEDVVSAEKLLLDYIYKNTDPTTFRKEWFEIKHEDFLLDLIQQAETNLPLVVPT